MAGSGEMKGAFDSAQRNLHSVSQYLMGSAGSADEFELILIGELLDASEPLLALWRTVTGADGATRGGGSIVGRLSDVRSRLFRAGHKLPANGEGTNIEAHLTGTVNTLDALINLLTKTTGSAARSPSILRKEATNMHQTARHQYALALQAPDSGVDAIGLAANHPGRVDVTRRLQRGAVDMARGVEAWTR